MYFLKRIYVIFRVIMERDICDILSLLAVISIDKKF